MGLTVVGHLSGGGTIIQLFSLVPDTFVTYNMVAGFSNVLSVDFIGNLGGVISSTTNIAMH